MNKSTENAKRKQITRTKSIMLKKSKEGCEKGLTRNVLLYYYFRVLHYCLSYVSYDNGVSATSSRSQEAKNNEIIYIKKKP